ncbi:uncharacterized protein LOC142563388 [Dermacentor variabilis]|uniref:uncharacterized protein LOC142563388 n=1 Tax=Dermacentor variabilis TaxID=34621 RepID=UPI003F5B7D7E
MSQRSHERTRLGLEQGQACSPFADREEQGLSVTVNNAATARPSETDYLQESTQMALPAGALRYRCIYCPYATRQRASLVVHERLHTGEWPFRCHVCNRGFAHRSHVVRHMRTHTGERPFSCPLCPAAFAQRSDVKVHMRTHKPHSDGRRRKARPANVGSGTADGGQTFSVNTKGPVQTCMLLRLSLEQGQACSPFADREEGLSAAVNNARAARPSETDYLQESTQTALPAGALRHRCIYCPYATRLRASLVVHERVHTGERPFRCHVCNRGFAHRSHVARHMRTHTGERPFSCPLCPAAFAQRSDVKVHMRTHNPHSGGRRRQARPANVGSVVL